MSGTVNETEAQIILDKHNCARRRYGVAPLKWDWQLAADAQVHADRCIWAHAKEIGKAPPQQQGENLSLAMGQPVGVDGWLREEPDYNCPNNQCVRNMCGHWTQMLWHDTARIGCAKRRCANVVDQNGSEIGFSNADMLVCRYSPPGNYIGRQPVTPKQCSKGASADSDCEPGEAVPGAVPVGQDPDPTRVGRDETSSIDVATLQLIVISVAILIFIMMSAIVWGGRKYLAKKRGRIAAPSRFMRRKIKTLQ